MFNFATFLPGWVGLAIGVVLYVFMVKDDWQQIGKLKKSLDLENRRLVTESEMPNTRDGVYTRYMSFYDLELRLYRLPASDYPDEVFMLRLLTRQDRLNVTGRRDLVGYFLWSQNISVLGQTGKGINSAAVDAHAATTALAEKFCALTSIKYVDATVLS